jgi:hypothetical protein
MDGMTTGHEQGVFEAAAPEYGNLEVEAKVEDLRAVEGVDAGRGVKLDLGTAAREIHTVLTISEFKRLVKMLHRVDEAISR